MQTNAKVIAMDLGASGGKCFAGLFDENGFTLKEIHRFTHEPTTLHIADRTGRVEERAYWDDLLISRNLVEGLRAYRRENGGAVDSVGIDSWGADGVFVTEDGVLLGPMYCYRDHRLDGMVEEVKSKMDPARLYEITGIHFQPFNVSNQLLWFVKNRGDLIRRGVRFLPAPTLFGWYLGGVTAIDSSWASVTQLMDARRKKWSKEVLRALSIPGRIMPRIVAPGTVVGELRAGLAESVGLNQARIIAVGAHDTASAFAAAPVSKAASALIISSGHVVADRQAARAAPHQPRGHGGEHEQRGRHRQRAIPEELHGHLACAGAAPGLEGSRRPRDGLGRAEQAHRPGEAFRRLHRSR